MRGNGGRENRWPGKPTDVKTAAAAGTPASRLTGYAFVPQLDCCFSEWGTKQSQHGPLFVARWLREEDTGDEVGDPSGGAVHMDGKSW